MITALLVHENRSIPSIAFGGLLISRSGQNTLFAPLLLPGKYLLLIVPWATLLLLLLLLPSPGAGGWMGRG